MISAASNHGDCVRQSPDRSFAAAELIGHDVAIMLVFGFIVGAALYLLPAVIGVAFGLGVSVLYAAAAQWTFNAEDLWLPLAVPILVQMPIAMLIGVMGQYLVERRLEKRMSRAISYYLPENIVRDLTEKHLDPSKSDRVVYGACLATDMSGFTRSPKRSLRRNWQLL